MGLVSPPARIIHTPTLKNTRNKRDKAQIFRLENQGRDDKESNDEIQKGTPHSPSPNKFKCVVDLVHFPDIALETLHISSESSTPRASSGNETLPCSNVSQGQTMPLPAPKFTTVRRMVKKASSLPSAKTVHCDLNLSPRPKEPASTDVMMQVAVPPAERKMVKRCDKVSRASRNHHGDTKQPHVTSSPVTSATMKNSSITHRGGGAKHLARSMRKMRAKAAAWEAVISNEAQ